MDSERRDCDCGNATKSCSLRLTASQNQTMASNEPLSLANSFRFQVIIKDLLEKIDLLPLLVGARANFQKHKSVFKTLC